VASRGRIRIAPKLARTGPFDLVAMSPSLDLLAPYRD
jgi:hypothetical protein